MTSWSTITLQIEENEYGEKEAPVELLTDPGIHEQGWLDEDRYYALSFGRHQHKRFDGFLLDFYSPIFSGITKAIVCAVNDTGDVVQGYVYKPKQELNDVRADGYFWNHTLDGESWPKEKRIEFKEHVAEETGIEPVVIPIENDAPPDMVCQTPQERFL